MARRRTAAQRAKDAERQRRKRDREAMGKGLVDGLEIDAEDYWALEMAGLIQPGASKEALRAAVKEALTEWRQQAIMSRVTLGARS